MSEDSTNKDGTDTRGNLDSTGEFFSVGMPLHAVRAGYIRRRADDQLCNTVLSGRYAHVLAPDRSGKSSLVAATAAKLESEGYKVAVLDLAQLSDKDGGSDSGRWYYSVAYRLLRQLRIRYDLHTWWQDKSVLSNRQRLFEFYSEILLQHVDGPVAIFIDEIQCIENLAYADQLLTSIRTAHNARTTDPDFSRLSFILLGECDPISLLQEAELSPFNVTQQILLDDFSREDLNLFSTELNMSATDAIRALDRIYFWTNGQPYLSQKIARAVAREGQVDDVEELIDRIVNVQIGGRAALHSEPHMSHIHRVVVNNEKQRERMLNLYGKIRKGIIVPADLGSPQQRRLMAVGLLVIDQESNLKIRNRLYELVFTARWANENLPTRLKVPAIVAGVILLLAAIPFWYTQWLPNPYVRTLASDEVELPAAVRAYENLRSFPGHADTADSLYRQFLVRRSSLLDSEERIEELAELVGLLPEPGRLADEIEANFWDRKMRLAISREDRDAALLASLESLTLATAKRRQRAAVLLGDDYPSLLSTLPPTYDERTVFDPVGMTMSSANGAQVSQYSYTPQGVQARPPWNVTALEVSPLVRRVIVDRQGPVSRIGLTLNISHARLSDLRVKVIAPSGRIVEVETGLERSSSNEDIRIPARQLKDLLGESLAGTWSISVRDESLGVAGQLVGWNLTLNSQGAIEHFQRGLNIPDPVERETDNLWFDPSGRYAVARAVQSDSARIWDLAFAEPVRTVALPESEVLIGLDASARHLITASQNRVSSWETATGDKVASLPIGAASGTAKLTTDRSHIFVERRGDVESKFELWNLQDEKIVAEIDIAGVPSLVAINQSGSHIAVADFDRAVRVWNLQSNELLGQFDLPAQPGALGLSADGSTMAIVYPNTGLSLWNTASVQRPLLEVFGTGDWQFSFSPSGSMVAAGRPETGFQIYASQSGSRIGPPLGLRAAGDAPDLLAFSHDEQVILTGDATIAPRLWRVPTSVETTGSREIAADNGQIHNVWTPSADRAIAVSPDGSFFAVGDLDGHVHILPAGATLADISRTNDDVSFVGHPGEVRVLSINASGTHVASVASDNSLRFWNAGTGEPFPMAGNVPGSNVSEITFSPDGNVIAASSDTHVSIIDVNDGELLAEFSAGSAHRSLAFATDNRLYLGTDDGALFLIDLGADNHWSMHQVWQGQESIRLLGASANPDYLILVDERNVASQFFLRDGRIGENLVKLPSEVHEIAFSHRGNGVYFRTSRWVHRVSVSPLGLIWGDAMLVPPVLNGARIVNGNGQSSASNQSYLPVAGNEVIEFKPLSFGRATETGLFGSKAELLEEWRSRLNAAAREEF